MDPHAKLLKESKSSLRTLTLMLKSETNVNEKQKILSYICEVKSFQNKFNLVKKQGKRPFGVEWEDIPSTFECRIRTGCIVNLTHKNTAEFFNESRPLFVRRVRNTLKKYTVLKINSIFNANFIDPNSPDQILKTFATKSETVDDSTNLNEFFKNEIESNILLKLQDSQFTLSAVVNLCINIHNPLVCAKIH